jgi:hypothetical protein
MRLEHTVHYYTEEDDYKPPEVNSYNFVSLVKVSAVRERSNFVPLMLKKSLGELSVCFSFDTFAYIVLTFAITRHYFLYQTMSSSEANKRLF